MEALKDNSQRDTPEQVIHGLVKKLTHHALWDALLIFLPPLAALLFCLYFLFIYRWISPPVATLSAFAAVALGVLAIALRYRPNIPSVPAAARLIDDRAGAADRFLTLATLPAPLAAAPLLSRLRAEAAELHARVPTRREFSYRIKRHVYPSLLISLAAAALFYLLLPLAHSMRHAPAVHERLRELAQQMAERPNLRETAGSLRKVAAKLEDPSVAPQEKQNLAQNERKKLEEQKENQPEQRDRELLKQAAGTLQGVEPQSGGPERKQEKQEGTGGIHSDLPEQSKGNDKHQEGSGGNSKGKPDSQLSDQMQQGKISQENPQDRGKEKKPDEKTGSIGNQPDPNQSAKDKQRPGKSEGGKDDRPGRTKVTEEIPQGAPPAERFYKPGEGEYQGIKGAGYVSVQLPEELAAEGKGVGQKKESKGGKTPGSQVPVSNIPLPKHVPDAPAEKQQMPLEYRGIIR